MSIYSQIMIPWVLDWPDSCDNAGLYGLIHFQGWEDSLDHEGLYGFIHVQGRGGFTRSCGVIWLNPRSGARGIYEIM